MRLLNKATAGLFQTLHSLKALDQGLANFFCKRSVKDSKYFWLVGRMVSVATTQLCPGVKAAVDNVQTNDMDMFQ